MSDDKPAMKWPGPPPEYTWWQKIVFWIATILVAWIGLLALVGLIWAMVAITAALLGGIF